MYCVSFINYNVNFPSNYLAVSNNCVTHTQCLSNVIPCTCNLLKNFLISNTCRNIFVSARRNFVFYPFNFSIPSLQKSITRLHGAVAPCESILHGCMEVSHRATAFYTTVWSFRIMRRRFTRLFGGFAPCESILHRCLGLSHHATAFYTAVCLFCSTRQLAEVLRNPYQANEYHIININV